MASPEPAQDTADGTQTPIAEALQAPIVDSSVPAPVKDSDKLHPLLTLAELQSSDETDEFWIAEIPSKMGDAILYFMRTALPDSHGNHLQHIRRFVKPENLPKPLKSVLPPLKRRRPPRRRRAGLKSRSLNTLPTNNITVTVEATPEKPPNPLYLVVCPTTMIAEAELSQLFRDNPSIKQCEYDFKIYRVQIPVKAPVNPEQAASLSERFWPVVYRPGGTYGPHKSIFQRAQEVIAPTAGDLLELARQAGTATKAMNIGETIGAAIVSYDAENKPTVLALAGDARWCHVTAGADPSCGNVMAHAVVRAIGMIGRRRVYASGQEVDESRDGYFFDQPVTDIEKEHFQHGELNQDSYLCLGHTIFVTHEPCVMCSMAILHSRFDRVVVGQRMPGTGGLTAEHLLKPDEERPEIDTSEQTQRVDALGYGLFYRPELNWKLLAWEWKDNEHKVKKRSTLHA